MSWSTYRWPLTTLFPMAVGVLFFVLGLHVDQLYFLGLVLVFPVTYLGRRLDQRAARAEIRAALREQWGQEARGDQDMRALERAYRRYRDQETEPDSLDDLTWRDLDMDAVFQRIDRTLSVPGPAPPLRGAAEPLDRRGSSRRAGDSDRPLPGGTGPPGRPADAACHVGPTRSHIGYHLAFG